MRHLAGQHIGDGFNAAVGMPWESGQVVRGIFVAEIVQQQKRIELLGLAEAKGRCNFTPAPSMVGFVSSTCFHCAKRHG